MAVGKKSKTLKDNPARRIALTAHDRSILVEAGAGSGKTAVMAGRIALMLADGVAPRQIVAVTFTELAASELLMRVRQWVADLQAGTVPAELRVALPDGLSHKQQASIGQAAGAIDELTCSTIHGFCQRLIKPYPAEANIDPGASIVDRAQADMSFDEIIETWLRERLSETQAGVLGEMVVQDAVAAVDLVHRIATAKRARRDLAPPPTTPLAPLIKAFDSSVKRFVDFLEASSSVSQPETEEVVAALQALHEAVTSLDLKSPQGWIGLLQLDPGKVLLTTTGTFRQYKRKGKWVAAAKAAGLSKAEGEEFNDNASACYQACADDWEVLPGVAAGHALAALMAEIQPVLDRFGETKRNSALLDFDDLIFAARDLLRDHPVVRQALGLRFPYVLVDEFQDTDPLQSEIFWRLCGDPPEDDPDADWPQYRIRPGALCLVGDPKQAIYRFRGADVSAYVAARSAFHEQDPESLLSISTNFRSRASILDFVNARFEPALSAPPQPGFSALDAFHADLDKTPAVVALEIEVADAEGKATAVEQRDAEAERVAELCARMIGHHEVTDRHTGQSRLCQAGDIALLAPTGTDLWRYEHALERRRVPVATQAGKGFYNRQEVQDLIALTRVLADRRDRLAFGALMRGPLVGLSEEELFDIVWQLPRSEQAPDKIPPFDLRTDPALVKHALAAEILSTLQGLHRRAHRTTPHALLSQAVSRLRVRPILQARHQVQAERALANVDLYLSMSAAYSVRGLQALSEAMTAAWTDQERAVEGRPDAQEASVSLVTMHSAKGLEWPIVIPINTMTSAMPPNRVVVDRRNNILYCPIFGVAPIGHATAFEAEQAELDRERVRLWYVATTRARELLVLPRLDVSAKDNAWSALIDLDLKSLPAFELEALSDSSQQISPEAKNEQTRDTFAKDARAIAERQSRVIWQQPSRNEGASASLVSTESEHPELWSDDGTDDHAAASPPLQLPTAVQGGRDRGLILHKLMEEILNGETSDTSDALRARATELIQSLGRAVTADASAGLSPNELADCVTRTLALPEIVELRPGLMAECAVYGMEQQEAVADAEVEDSQGKGECVAVTVGIADAIALTESGTPDVVIDWKSDVEPGQDALNHYRDQVAKYLQMTGARLGLIVLMSTGKVVSVKAAG